MGSTMEELSTGGSGASEDPRHPSSARTVHFQDQTPLARPRAVLKGTGHEKVNRTVSDLPHFAGKTGESLRDFLSRMAMAAEMGNWEPGFRRARTHFQLKGTAMQYINGLPEDQVNTLEGLEVALKARYQGKLVQKDAKEELRILKRRASETPEDYGLRIQNLTRTAYPGDPTLQEEEGVSAFLRGLSDQKAAEMFIFTKKDTVQDCVQTLAEAERHRTSVGRAQGPLRLRQLEEQPEVTTVQNKVKASPARAVQTPAVDSRMDKLEKEMGKRFEAMEGQFRAMVNRLDRLANWPSSKRGPPPPQNPSKDRPCLNCGSAKHWASSCPEKRRNRLRQDQRSGNDQGLDQRSEGQSSTKQ